MKKFRVEIDYLVGYEPAYSTAILYIEAKDDRQARCIALDWFHDVKRQENYGYRLPLFDVSEL